MTAWVRNFKSKATLESMVWLVSFDSEIRNQAPLARTNFGIGTLETAGFRYFPCAVIAMAAVVFSAGFSALLPAA